MRISTAWRYEQGVAQMMRQQEKIATTQNQLSSNQKWKTAADDPAGWAQAQSYDQLVAQTRQYTSNAQAAQQRLQLSEDRSEEHTSELQSLMRISYAVFCLKKKRKTTSSKLKHIVQYKKHT